MLPVVCFISFFLWCQQAEAAITKLTGEPSNPSAAIEMQDFTLVWNYTVDGSVLLAQFTNVTGGGSETIARKHQAGGTTNVEPKYQDRFSADISVTQAWLKITRVQISDKGKYKFLLALTGSGNIEHEIQLIVNFPPRLFNNVSAGEQTVKEGQDLDLYCGASGNPAPNITWIRVFENGSESQVLLTDATWNIVRINRTDAGNYSCTANNGVGSPVSCTITVNVLYPPKIVNFVQEYKVAVQQSVTLHCQAEGFPEPTFTWSPCKDGCNTDALVIPEVLNDTEYTCTVTNSEGKDSASVCVVIAGREINITMTITSERCTDGKYNESSLSKKLSDAMKEVFLNEIAYLSTTVRGVSCGSLTVDLTLSFNAVVTEKQILNVLKEATEDGRLGDFSVDASSIKGIRPVIPITSRPGIGKITPKPPDDSNLTIILAVVIPIAVLAVSGGIVAVCMRNKNKDKKKINKEVGDKNTGRQQVQQIQRGRSSRYGDSGYQNTHSSSASLEKTGDIIYDVVETDQRKSMSRTSGATPKKFPRTYEIEVLVEAPETKPVSVVYAQMDKSKKKRKQPQSKRPGELQHAQTLRRSTQEASTLH